MVTLADVEAAASTLAGQVVRTPCMPAPALSARVGAKLFLKLENMQYTSSFKDRGACNKLQNLDAAERAQGVIAMSAGNHAQGVAYHAQRLGIPATIVMPEGTANTKVLRTERLGARVVLWGEALDEAAAHAEQLREQENLVFISPYDDETIIAGQGTVALEMLADVPALEALVVPIGGGGLIAGMAVAAKALKPEIEIIGVETELFPSMYRLLRGEPAHCGGQTLADGIAVKAPGKLTHPLIRDLVDDVVLVSEIDIERAVAMLLEEEKTVAEGAGATPLAMVLGAADRFRGRHVGLVVSGGNIDTRLLASVLMRGLLRDGRIARMRVAISDRPGVLAGVSAAVAACGANILEVVHQRAFLDVPAKLADLDIVLETRDPADVARVLERLRADGYPARLITGQGGET